MPRFARRDMAEIMRRTAPEFEVIQSTEVPWGQGLIRSVEGLRQFLKC